MKSITVELSETIYLQVEEFARRTARRPEDVLREFVEQRWAPPSAAKGTSLFDHEPASLGASLEPWSTRAEMLEGFFDRD